MKHRQRNTRLITIIIATAFLTATAWAQDRVSETVHNLSASGPGRVRAPSEQQVCIFCHAPHNTAGVRPLWNRELPMASYRIYESSTLDARPDQPTGTSKLCLSCHDGTIALGSVLSRSDQIRISGGDFMPAGLANLGTDLSDDHPVSLAYTSGLAAADRQLASPSALPKEVKLDGEGKLQCTSCHDPHHNEFGNFLVMNNSFGALCVTCHKMNGWANSSHSLSTAVIAGPGEPDWPYSTVAENACRACHRQHTAGGAERLMIFEQEQENCLSCHNGRIARTDIRAELDKLSAHDPRRYQGIHDPVETHSRLRPHVECSDCHNPHATVARTDGSAGSNTSGQIGPTLKYTPGVTIGGTHIDEARHEYEVCFRCHAESNMTRSSRIGRQSQSPGVRLKFMPNNASYHPVVSSAASRDTISLRPGLTAGSLIRCTDCHNNNAGPRAGGSGPDGPHGSEFDFLLERNYTVYDDVAESDYEYALCYKCHQRSSILSDQSFRSHRRHIVDERTPCSACHDPHGISRTQALGSDHTHLINFDTSIVRPDSVSRRLQFKDLGTFSGSCTLTCHGSRHFERAYGPQAASPFPGR